MTNSIWERIAETPWWLAVFFIFFVWLAFLATKPQVISVKQLFVLPILFFLLSLGIFFYLPFKTSSFFLWTGAILLGAPLGWLHFRLFQIKAIKDQAKLYLPGNWGLFIFIMIISALKYHYGDALPLDVRMIYDPHIMTGIAVLYGLFIGLYIGRMTYALRCLKNGPYAAITE